MEKSPSIAEISKALNKFQSKMPSVGFDANNPFFKSKYATLAAIVTTAKTYLADEGLSISQLLEGEGGVTTILMHISGEYLSSTLTLKSVKDDPQGHGSAISYARRYAYASILGIVADTDDDGNAATGLTSKASSSPKVELKLDLPAHDTNEDKVTPEQGQALLKLIKAYGYEKEDIKAFIENKFGLTSLMDIQTKHLMPIKEYFEKKSVKAGKAS